MESTKQKLLVIGVIGVGAWAIASIIHGKPTKSAVSETSDATSAEVTPEAKNPRLLLRRFWLDRLPEERGDVIDAWLFLGGGIGLEEKGSPYRFSLDLFEFERRGSAFDLVWFHDKKAQSVPFTIVECHDKPPFDLCLDLKEPLRGHKRLWSFDDEADMDTNVPWARDWMAASEARARTVR